jgi:hypothetical protein
MLALLVFRRNEKFSKVKKREGAAGGYTVKKVNDFPSPAGMSLAKLSLAGNN